MTLPAWHPSSGGNTLFSPLRIHLLHILRPDVFSGADFQCECANRAWPMRTLPGIFASSMEEGGCLSIGAVKVYAWIFFAAAREALASE